MEKLRNLLATENVVVVEESKLEIQKSPDQIVGLPKLQKHIIYLGIKKHPGQYIGVAVAGTCHWNEGLATEPSAGSFDPQIRLFLMTTK